MEDNCIRIRSVIGEHTANRKIFRFKRGMGMARYSPHLVVGGVD